MFDRLIHEIEYYKVIKKYNYEDWSYGKLHDVKSNKNKFQNYLYITITTLNINKTEKTVFAV